MPSGALLSTPPSHYSTQNSRSNSGSQLPSTLISLHCPLATTCITRSVLLTIMFLHLCQLCCPWWHQLCPTSLSPFSHCPLLHLKAAMAAYHTMKQSPLPLLCPPSLDLLFHYFATHAFQQLLYMAHPFASLLLHPLVFRHLSLSCKVEAVCMYSLYVNS